MLLMFFDCTLRCSKIFGVRFTNAAEDVRSFPKIFRVPGIPKTFLTFFEYMYIYSEMFEVVQYTMSECCRSFPKIALTIINDLS